ncbi:unnamed protein product, partial [Ostreobium quekettii]
VDCLRKWASARRVPLCPLCAAPIHTIVLPDGEEEPVVPSTARADEEEPDLACLDHTYFLSETQRLLSRAEVAQNNIYREAFGAGRKGSNKAEHAVATLGDVISSLLNHRHQLELEFPFGANELLQELYSLDSIVQSVQAGTWERCVQKQVLLEISMFFSGLGPCFRSVGMTGCLDVQVQAMLFILLHLVFILLAPARQDSEIGVLCSD